MPLSTGIQGRDLYIWAMVDEDAEDASYRVWVRGTGHESNGVDGGLFVGTVHAGPLVWHVFAERP